MPSSKAQPLLTIPQLADRWRWAPRKIRRLVQAKQIPHVRIGGGIYFEEAVMDAWIAARREGYAAMTPASANQTSGRSREEECALLGIPVNHKYAF